MWNWSGTERQGILGSLNDRQRQKLARLAEACGASLDEEFCRTALDNLFRVVPNNVNGSHLVPPEVQRSIRSITRDGEYIVIELDDGKRLATFPSRQQYRNFYYAFMHLLPDHFTPDSYQGCRDIGFRYRRGMESIQRLIDAGLIIPSERTSFLECGAFIGWKALGYSRHLGERGKIVALEIDPRQYAVAKLNLEMNLDPGRFAVLNAGIWNKVERRPYTFQHYASHSLRVSDEHQKHDQSQEITTTTLDNVIDESGVEVFDFLNIQTNGSELESVQGLDRNLDRVKVMYVGTHYVQDGVSVRHQTIRHLLERGCRVYCGQREITSIDRVPEDETGGFRAVTPKYADTLQPKAATAKAV